MGEIEAWPGQGQQVSPRNDIDLGNKCEVTQIILKSCQFFLQSDRSIFKLELQASFVNF